MILNKNSEMLLTKMRSIKMHSRFDNAQSYMFKISIKLSDKLGKLILF